MPRLLEKVLVERAKAKLMDFNFDDQFDSQVIGVDEVGKGSWAGTCDGLRCFT